MENLNMEDMTEGAEKDMTEGSATLSDFAPVGLK
jgi:hypothetical protein